MHSIFDSPTPVGVHGQMYQAWAAPDLFPDEPQPVLSNWHPEDLAAFVGGTYTQPKGTLNV